MYGPGSRNKETDSIHNTGALSSAYGIRNLLSLPPLARCMALSSLYHFFPSSWLSVYPHFVVSMQLCCSC